MGAARRVHQALDPLLLRCLHSSVTLFSCSPLLPVAQLDPNMSPEMFTLKKEELMKQKGVSERGLQPVAGCKPRPHGPCIPRAGPGVQPVAGCTPRPHGPCTPRAGPEGHRLCQPCMQ